MKMEENADMSIPDRPQGIGRDAMLFQWMRNKESGQSFGNQMIVARLTPELYGRYVKQLTKVKPCYADHDRRFPGLYVSLIRQNNRGGWRLFRVSDLRDVLPKPEDPRWVIQVSSFDSRDALQQGRMADSELDPITPTGEVIP